ncbi:hypothetical protein PC116_g7304 [Phytophthora cactorum]|uniref:Uncharacterized protein n=1 Tax=Phytophthora cactorum TaxID=29920 RepID=A0A8T1CJD4_9STRA|nr:hypothetical protein Pcac1_g23105 [Phytophthora cactorum]KAG2854087.1 hypothetical protein PC113_g13618 [Phytophthora cactorum]KAG2924520.1 hypothetical protein PC115_g8587 [Phytophthora cactorum]KAG2982114.1 hypothetical protein PC118_g10160 [Phytophthora cactorum]KAG3087043.1 hypothetical protein PC122_g8984 [Phytophthora cactorum]
MKLTNDSALNSKTLYLDVGDKDLSAFQAQAAIECLRIPRGG